MIRVVATVCPKCGFMSEAIPETTKAKATAMCERLACCVDMCEGCQWALNPDKGVSRAERVGPGRWIHETLTKVFGSLPVALFCAAGAIHERAWKEEHGKETDAGTQ